MATPGAKRLGKELPQCQKKFEVEKKSDSNWHVTLAGPVCAARSQCPARTPPNAPPAHYHTARALPAPPHPPTTTHQDGSPYAGGKFVLDVALPAEYPFKPPVVKFLTKIYHPSVTAEGAICADTFEIAPDKWGPTKNMLGVLNSFAAALADPTPAETPSNPEAATAFVEDRAAFDRTAAAWVAEHAQ
jgi:ubiquitin-protein ligase